MLKMSMLLLCLLASADASAQTLPRILCNGGFLGYPASLNFQGAASCTAVPSLGALTVNLSAVASSGSTLLLGNGAGGFSNYVGASCTNQFPRSLSTAGAATCATVAFATDTSGTVGVTRGGSGLTTVAADQVYVGTATDTLTAKALPSCANATTSKLLYDTSTHTFSCGADQSSTLGYNVAALMRWSSDATQSMTSTAGDQKLSFTQHKEVGSSITSNNTDRLTVQTTGTYRVRAGLTEQPNGVSAWTPVAWVTLYKNGVFLRTLAWSRFTSGGFDMTNGRLSVEADDVLDLVATDYLEVFINTSTFTGGPVLVIASHFIVERIA